MHSFVCYVSPAAALQNIPTQVGIERLVEAELACKRKQQYGTGFVYIQIAKDAAGAAGAAAYVCVLLRSSQKDESRSQNWPGQEIRCLQQ